MGLTMVTLDLFEIMAHFKSVHLADSHSFITTLLSLCKQSEFSFVFIDYIGYTLKPYTNIKNNINIYQYKLE